MYHPPHPADEYDSPPQYEPPPVSSPSALASPDSIDVALSAFATLTPADIGDVLHPHLSYLFAHLSTASLRSLIAAAGIRQQWRQLPRPVIERMAPFLPIHSYLALCAASRHYRTIVHQPQWQRLQRVQLTGRADDNLNQHNLTLFKRSLPYCTHLTLRSVPLTPLLLLSLDRFSSLQTLHLTHCTIATSATALDVWLALGSSSTLHRLHTLHIEAISSFDDESLFQLVVDDGKQPCVSLTALRLIGLQLSGLCGPALASLARCFPALADLSLAHNEDLSDTCILSLAAAPPPLTGLSVAHCPMLSMASVQAMRAFVALSKLDLTSCFQITSLTPLASLPITSLSTAYTALPPSTFTAITHLPLHYLHLSTHASALPAWLHSTTLPRPARLHLRWDEAEDDGLGWLAAMGVIELELTGRKVTDAGLVRLLSGYVDGGRGIRGADKDRVSAGVSAASSKEERKVVEEKKDARDASKSKGWFNRIKTSTSSSATASSPTTSPPPAQPSSPTQPLPPSYLSSALPPAPPLPLHLQTLVLRNVGVSDVGLLRCLVALLPLGLVRVDVLQCSGVSWKVVEWLMNWRREHRQDVRVLYEL